jgi:hypothetical protein
MKTMTETLKHAIRKSGESLYAIHRATGVDSSALGKFMAGKQSLRLDLADKLAEYFGIECRMKKGR